MRTPPHLLFAGAVAASLLAAAAPVPDSSALAQTDDTQATIETAGGHGALTEDELLVLHVAEAVLRLFDDGGVNAWPGYSLARQPFMVYMPDRWALVFNVGPAADGFGPPPGDWGALGHDALYHEGAYDDLVGQLAFSVAVDDTETVALGFPEGMAEEIENAASKAFAYVVHEAFHQYQYSAFGETPWEREERYPISDSENAARAWLEMRVLEDAMEALEAGDDETCERRTVDFVAVRTRRWDYAPPFVESFERGKELLEGTAKYVELRCVEMMEDVDYVSSVDGRPDPLADAFPPASMPHLIAHELSERRGETALEPQDIPRNRIYAVASAEAFLLDHFGVDWKHLAETESADFTYVDLLVDRLGLEDAALATRADSVEAEYGYQDILAAATEALRVYKEGYASELASFESQEGTRVEVSFSAQGVYRSRSSRTRKWLMDEGRITLCSLFGVYTLQGEGWSFELKNAGLLETNDWDAHMREIAFYSSPSDSIRIDGRPLSGLPQGSRTFESIEMSGPGFELKSDHHGAMEMSDDAVRVDLDAETE